MGQTRKYQLLADGLGLAEHVGFYTGANGHEGISIFKIKEKYYLAQNPTSGSVFGAFTRRGYPVFWELNAYPDRKVGLQYSGNVICLFKLWKTAELRQMILKTMGKESALLKMAGLKQIVIKTES